MYNIIDGKRISAEVKEEARQRVLALNETGRKILKDLKSDIPVLKTPTKKDYYNIEFLKEVMSKLG